VGIDKVGSFLKGGVEESPFSQRVRNYSADLPLVVRTGDSNLVMKLCLGLATVLATGGGGTVHIGSFDGASVENRSYKPRGKDNNELKERTLNSIFPPGGS
jgi:hypothetical protein